VADVLAVATVAGTERGHNRPAVVPALAALVLVVIAGCCVFAPAVASFDPAALSTNRFATFSTAHLMGTDELGRDLFSRMLFAGRISLGVAGGATVVALVLGAAWGMLAAFSRGFVGEVLMRLCDTAMAVPQMLLALIFVAAFGATPVKLAFIVGILLTPVTARMIRSAALTERAEDYYLAAVAYGAPKRRLILTEVLPNVWAPIGVQAAINVSNGIVLEAALSFIGLGIQDPDISWGLLVKYGFAMQSRSLGYVAFPALMIFITIWMLNLLADQLGRADAGSRS
jgi:peptide/nickel transport system permease protein